MKLKYYLRGVGIGVFFTTLIFMISLSMNQNKNDSQSVAATETVGRTVSQAEEQKTTEVLTETETQKPEVPVVPDTQAAARDTQTPAPDTQTAAQTPQPAAPSTEQSQAASEAPAADQTASEAVSEPPATPQTVSFIVSPGDTSNIVAAALKSNNLVDDAAAFNKYLVDNKFDGSIYPGTYEIQAGLTYDQLAKILTTK